MSHLLFNLLKLLLELKSILKSCTTLSLCYTSLILLIKSFLVKRSSFERISVTLVLHSIIIVNMSVSKDADEQDHAAGTIHSVDLAPTSAPPHKLASLTREDHAAIIHELAGSTYSAYSDTDQSLDRHDLGNGPPGTLYSDIIQHRKHLTYKYNFLSTFYNTALLLQILLGATITALSGLGSNNQVVLAVLAASNTVNAGVLALMHNSGLPAKLKNDLGEFEKVEQHVRALIETGVIKEGWSRQEVVADCWERYMKCRAAIGRNRVGYYKGAEGNTPVVGPGRV